MLHLLPHLLMRKWGVKTVVRSNIFPVVGEFGFFVGARHGVPLLPFFPAGCEEM
jgi:hypothetical protein